MSFPAEFVEKVKGIARSNTALHEALDGGDEKEVERILLKACYGALNLYFEESLRSRPYPTTVKKVEIVRDLYEEFLKIQG